MGELASALDALATDDLDALPLAEQLHRIRTLVAAQNRIAALLTRAVRRAEVNSAVEHDGLRSTKSWLRTHTRLSDATARRLVEGGRALEALPAVEQVFAAGAISAEAVAAIAPVATPDRLARAAEQGVDVTEVAETLAVLATQVSHSRLREAVGFYMGRRRRDLPGELGPPVRTPPRQGPSRVPHPSRHRRPMAQLSP